MAREKEFLDQIRGQTKEELEVTYIELNKKLFELKNQLAMEKKLEQPNLLKEIKKNVARVLTVLNEKQSAA